MNPVFFFGLQVFKRFCLPYFYQPCPQMTFKTSIENSPFRTGFKVPRSPLLFYFCVKTIPNQNKNSSTRAREIVQIQGHPVRRVHSFMNHNNSKQRSSKHKKVGISRWEGGEEGGRQLIKFDYRPNSTPLCERGSRVGDGAATCAYLDRSPDREYLSILCEWVRVWNEKFSKYQSWPLGVERTLGFPKIRPTNGQTQRRRWVGGNRSVSCLLLPVSENALRARV